MGHFLPAVTSVLFVSLFIGALTAFNCGGRARAFIGFRTALTAANVSVFFYQLCALRSASTAAACPPIRASASRDGEAWTAPVVSARQLLQKHISV